MRLHRRTLLACLAAIAATPVLAQKKKKKRRGPVQWQPGPDEASWMTRLEVDLNAALRPDCATAFAVTRVDLTRNGGVSARAVVSMTWPAGLRRRPSFATAPDDRTCYDALLAAVVAEFGTLNAGCFA